jgi:hypothetical protein
MAAVAVDGDRIFLGRPGGSPRRWLIGRSGAVTGEFWGVGENSGLDDLRRCAGYDQRGEFNLPRKRLT